MSHIPYPDMDSLSQQKREAMAKLPRGPLNITRVALHAPDSVWRPFYEFKEAMVHGTTLDPRLREVLILRVAYLLNSRYELHHHLSISSNLGFPAQLQAAIRDQRYGELAHDERIVAQFTDEVVQHSAPSAEMLSAARAAFGDPLVVEMIILIGSYVGTAYMAAATGIELDAEPVQGWKPPATETAA